MRIRWGRIAIIGGSVAAVFLAGVWIAPFKVRTVTETVTAPAPPPQVRLLQMQLEEDGDENWIGMEKPSETPLGLDTDHSKENKIGRTIIAYEMWANPTGLPKQEPEPVPGWCRNSIPIIAYGYDPMDPEGGCDGACPGPTRTLLGYRNYCGPWRYYIYDDCMSDVWRVGMLYARDMIASGRGWGGHYDGVRFQCKPVRTDSYPVNDYELRDPKAVDRAAKAVGAAP